jgi:tetratricopeptide (TPR) repeat protein
MRRLPCLLVLPCLLALAGSDRGHAAEPVTPAEARERWLRGNYDEARADYESLAKDPGQRTAAAIGLSRVLQSQGHYEQALAAVESAVSLTPDNAALLARKADLLYFQGRWDDALKAVDAALAAEKNNLSAHWTRLRIWRDRGDLKKAAEEARWFVRAYNDGDISDPEQLLLVGLASAEHARWNNLSDQFADILNDLLGEAAKKDKSFWPAEYEAAMLLLEKYNRPEAQDALEKALTINPNAAEAIAAKGVAALMQFEIKDAETLAERALKINPSCPEALRLRADVDLASGDAAAALRELDVARRVNPRDERTLGRIAAALTVRHKAADVEALAKEVGTFDSKPAVFYFEFGERLDELRRFDEAEKHLRKAAALRPNMPGPSNSLGILYMRMGREKEAAPLLDKGFAADPFNVRVSNMRKVLKHLDNYRTVRTEHFELRFDPAHDAALARYMGDYLENIYADLSRQFGHSPRGPILIEVFNNHDMFSGRVVALPDLHTIGACTGRMVAMASPHAKGIRKPFNWARVLRHELVHIFNLEQTHFLVPHWLTEGLAVGNEGFPRPPVWEQLLRERVPAGELMNLDTVDLGFIRPRDPLEWQMAYCQSQLYVNYLKQTYGPEIVGQLLAAYGDGLTTDEVVKKVCKVDKADLEKGYHGYLEELVKGLPGRPADKRKKLAQLKEEHEKDPDDPEAAAALAEALVNRDRVEARKLAKAVLEKKKGHPRASLVLARLEKQAGNAEQERALLEGALDRNSPDPKVLQALAKIYYDASEFPKATEVLEQGRKAEPGDPDWLQGLARVYAQTGDKDKLIAVLKELVPTDADDFEHRKKLANLLAEAGNWAEAEKYCREALEIDLSDAEVRTTLDKALREQKKTSEADRIRELLGDTKGANKAIEN